MKNGAKVVKEPWIEEDENGKVIMATISTFGDTTHTFIQRSEFKGIFLPNYEAIIEKDPLESLLPSTKLNFIDHCVGNQPDLEMISACDFYEKQLGFHRFWSVDDEQIHTEYSALRSIVMADWDERVKIPINEPATGKKKSQIQEFVDYYGGAGIQHIAFNTKNILKSVQNLKDRGLEFLSIPSTYYTRLREKLNTIPSTSRVNLDINEETLKELERLHILVDYDEKDIYYKYLVNPSKIDRPFFSKSSNDTITKVSERETLKVYSSPLKWNKNVVVICKI